MKKIIWKLLLVLISLNAQVFCEEVFDVISLKDGNEKEVIYEEPILLEENEKNLVEIINQNDFSEIAPNGILNDKLTIKFNKGPIKEHKTELMSFFGFSETMDSDDSDFNFRVLFLKLGFMGKFRSEKEKYVITTNLTPNLGGNFFHNLMLDSYIESSRIPHHKLKIGTFRPAMGYEGSMALFLIPFIYKTQIARNLSDARKTGASLKGEYKYIDYSIEGFSSSTKYESFFPGAEGLIWLDFKPLAKFDNRYGNLKIGGGYQSGSRDSTDYNTVAVGMKYDYKNFWITSEYARADGSNAGDGLTNKNRQGYNVTLCYKPIDKLELLLRFDDFDNDLDISNNNTREYSAGMNYYIYEESVVLMLNYSYLENEIQNDSHRFIIGAQILI